MSLLHFQLGLENLSKRSRPASVINPIEGQRGGIPYLALLGSQNAIGSTPPVFTSIPASTQTDGNTEMEFVRRPNQPAVLKLPKKEVELRLPKTIIPGTSVPIPKTPILPGTTIPEKTPILPGTTIPEKTPILPGTTIPKTPILPGTTIPPEAPEEPIRTDIHSNALADLREKTEAPSLKPPYNLPQEQKQYTDWVNYVRRRYGTDAGRLELDRLKVNQLMYEVAIQGWKKANAEINRFKYDVDAEGNTAESREIKENFGKALLQVVFGFLTGKVNSEIVNTILSGFKPSEVIPKEVASTIANQFLSGVKTGLQYLTNSSFSDVAGDLQKLKHSLLPEVSWRTSFNRVLKNEAEKTSPNAGEETTHETTNEIPQVLELKKSMFPTKSKAVKWAVDNGYKHGTMTETATYYNINQVANPVRSGKGVHRKAIHEGFVLLLPTAPKKPETYINGVLKDVAEKVGTETAHEKRDR